jgi:quercetin dioxygenase-like cupin family protein
VSIPLPKVDPSDPRWNKRGAIYIPSGEGPTVWAAGDVYTVKFAGSQTRGGFGLIDATVPAGGGPVAHVHPNEEETFYMVSGELEFLDGDHTFTAVAGDLVHIPRGTRHRFRNKGIHAARMLFMFTPAGPEQAIADHAMPAKPGETPPPLNEDLINRMQVMSRLTKMISLPEPE